MECTQFVPVLRTSGFYNSLTPSSRNGANNYDGASAPERRTDSNIDFFVLAMRLPLAKFAGSCTARPQMHTVLPDLQTWTFALPIRVGGFPSCWTRVRQSAIFQSAKKGALHTTPVRPGGERRTPSCVPRVCRSPITNPLGLRNSNFGHTP